MILATVDTDGSMQWCYEGYLLRNQLMFFFENINKASEGVELMGMTGGAVKVVEIDDVGGGGRELDDRISNLMDHTDLGICHYDLIYAVRSVLWNCYKEY
jgi:hypothetical protein